MRFIPALLLSVAMLATGCARQSGFSGSEEPVFRRPDAAVASLDPALAGTMSAARAVGLVYETLLQFDYSARPYKLIPYAAEAMPEVSDDGRTLKLRLRDDIWFGPDPCLPGPEHRRKACAEDFIFQVKRIADAKISSSGFWLVEGKIEGIDSFREASRSDAPTDYSMPVSGLRAIDERTIEITLTRPCPDFLWALAMPYLSLVPHEAVDTYGKEFGLHEAGSGPFTLRAWQRAHRISFARRPGRDNTRDASPPAEGTLYGAVEYIAMSDPSTQWLAFMRGDFDAAFDISRDNWDAVITPDGTLAPDLSAAGMRLESEPALESTYVGFNMDDPVVGKNAKLRQALCCAFDSVQWCELSRGRTIPSNGPIPPGIEGRVETPHPYSFNLEKARALLAEAGYPGGVDSASGKHLELTLDLGRSDPETRESAELLASFFDKIGVRLHLQYSTFPQFMTRLNKREEQLFLVTWVADYPDPLNFLQLFHSCNVSPGPNRTNYVNPQYDVLFDEAASCQDEARRAELLEKMQETIRTDCPWICLHYRRASVLVRPSLKGFKMHDFPIGMEKHWRHLD